MPVPPARPRRFIEAWGAHPEQPLEEWGTAWTTLVDVFRPLGNAAIHCTRGRTRTPGNDVHVWVTLYRADQPRHEADDSAVLLLFRQRLRERTPLLPETLVVNPRVLYVPSGYQELSRLVRRLNERTHQRERRAWAAQFCPWLSNERHVYYATQRATLNPGAYEPHAWYA